MRSLNKTVQFYLTTSKSGENMKPVYEMRGKGTILVVTKTR